MYIGTLLYIGMLHVAIALSICHHCVVHTLHAFLQSARDYLFSHIYHMSASAESSNSKTWNDPQTTFPQTRFGSLVSGLSGTLGQYD